MTIDCIGFEPASDDAFVWLLLNGKRCLRVITWCEACRLWGLERRFDRRGFERAIRANILDLVR